MGVVSYGPGLKIKKCSLYLASLNESPHQEPIKKSSRLFLSLCPLFRMIFMMYCDKGSRGGTGRRMGLVFLFKVFIVDALVVEER
jgi:hypothetical protein